MENQIAAIMRKLHGKDDESIKHFQNMRKVNDYLTGGDPLLTLFFCHSPYYDSESMPGQIRVPHDFELTQLVRFCETDGNLSKARDLANSFVKK